MKAEGSQAFRARCRRRTDAAEKGKQPFLNEPLKGCPLSLGFLVFIVNPSQASSAAQSAIIHSPKSGGWKRKSLNARQVQGGDNVYAKDDHFLTACVKYRLVKCV